MANTKKTASKGCPLDRGVLRYVVPAVIMAIGAGFLIYGIFDGEINAVLSKAVALCRECVGIG